MLAFELREDIAQRLSSRLQGLGQPFTHLSPCQFMDDQGRIAQDPVKILPDQIVPAFVGPVNAFEMAEPEAFCKEVVALVEIAAGGEVRVRRGFNPSEP